jgi:hypothetical protein
MACNNPESIMAKARRQRKGKDYSDEDYWKEWGERFEKRMERWGDSFGERMDRNGKRFSRRWEERYNFFGPVGPLIMSVMGIVFLLIGVIFLKIINYALFSPVVSGVINFILDNLYIFFGVSVLSSYSKYTTRIFPTSRWLISPLAGSVGITFALWVLVQVFGLMNAYLVSSFITSAVSFVGQNLIGIFAVLLVVGYLFEAFRMAFGLRCWKGTD